MVCEVGGGRVWPTIIIFIYSLKYVIQQSFIGRPSDSAVSEDAGIELRTAATLTMGVRRSNYSARSHLHETMIRQGLVAIKKKHIWCSAANNGEF
jgi:hypothetical protein